MRLAREKLVRGETLYLAGLGAPGTHNSGVALVEVTQARGPRLILNNEEERFSGNKHTTEYPQKSVDAMVEALRGMGRSVGDIFAWLTSWDYPTLAGTHVPLGARGSAAKPAACCAPPRPRVSTAAGSTR